jgi:O-Antigen ligase
LTLTAYNEARPMGRVTKQSLDPAAGARLAFPVKLYLLTVILPVLFNAGSLALSAQRVLLLLMVVPLSINLVRGKYGRLIWTDIFFFLHIGWAAIAMAVNNPDRVIQNAGSTSVEFLGGYLVGRAYIRSVDDFLALIRVFVFMVCCTLPLALFETMTGRPIVLEWIRKIPGITSVGIVNIDPRMGLERVQALFAHPIHYGLFCGTAFSLLFVGLKGIASTATRYIAGSIIGLCVFVSLSSGALLPILLQIFLIFWAFSLNSVRQRWLILFGLFVMAYVAIDLLSNRTPIKVFMTYATFSAHNAYWRSLIFEWGMVNVRAHPIFGIGLNDWVRPFFMRSGSMDNFWLVNAVRYGIPGFFLLILGYLPALWKIGRRNFDADLRLWQLRRAWVFTFAGLTLTLCTVHVWTSIYSFVFFLFGAGMWFLTAGADTSAQPTLVEQTPRRPKISFSRNFPDRTPTNRSRDAERPVLARPAPAPKHQPSKDATYARTPMAPRHKADDP